MVAEHVAPKLRFVGEFSDKAAFDARGGGYLSHVMAEFADGRLYPIFFYDIVRLQQDLEENVKQGRIFVADPGMIVVDEITPEAMKQAVEQLGREGFFDRLTAITQADLASGDPYRWPPQIAEKRTTKTGKSRGKATKGKAMGTR